MFKDNWLYLIFISFMLIDNKLAKIFELKCMSGRSYGAPLTRGIQRCGSIDSEISALLGKWTICSIVSHAGDS